MADAVLKALLFSLAPVTGMGAGGVAAVWREPSRQIRSYIQHFAAGIVFAAVGVEILPDVMHRDSPAAAAAGFALGVVAMLVIRATSRQAESSTQESSSRTPWTLLAAVGVDVFVDGMLIGVGFAIGQRQGSLLAVALTGCAVSLGLATAAAILRSGGSRRRAATLTFGIAVLSPVGAGVGVLFTARLTGAWMEVVLSFTCAALLYLITEELLVEAHESQRKPETAFTTAVFFIGFLAVLVTAMLM